MIRVVVKSRAGIETTLHADPEQSLMEVIRSSDNSDILAICGGSCSCGTCHVFVDTSFVDKLPMVGTAEEELLTCSAHCVPGKSRLACQIRLIDALDGLSVVIAPED